MKKLGFFVAMLIAFALSCNAQTISASATSICAGDSVVLTFGVSATDTIDLQIFDGSISSMNVIGDSLVVHPLISSVYQIVSVNGTPVTPPSVVSVTVYQHPMISISTILIGCNEYKSTVTLQSGQVPATYSWSNSSINSNENLFFGGDTILLTVSDNTGCAVDTSVVMPIMPSITIDSIVTTPQTCQAATAMIFAHGGTALSYLWLNDSVTGYLRNNLEAGTYTIRVSDANFCHVDTTITIQQTQNLRAFVTHNNIGCYGGSDGSAEVIALGGTAPYSYMWSNGSSNPIQDSLNAGYYSVIVSDANGCTDTASITIMQPNEIMTNIEILVSNNDTSLLVNVFGGVSPYIYTWNTGETSNVINNIHGGHYSVIVSDANGCSKSDSIDITAIENIQVIFDLSSTAHVCYNSDPVVLANYVTITPNNGGLLQFVGSGVVDGVFYPSMVSIGTYQITAYYISPNGTAISSYGNISVHGPMTLDWNFPYSYVSVHDSPIELTGGSPSGGIYSGPGVYESNGSYYFNPAAAGIGYYQLFYEYTTPYECYSNITRNIHVTNSAGIDDFQSNPISIYPNPATNVLNVSSEENIQSIQIFSLTGMKVIEIIPNTSSYVIDVTNLPAGAYFLQLQCDGKIERQRIIKQ